MLTTPEEDDDEERYVDATDEEDEEDEDNKTDKKEDLSTQQPAITTYDGRKRDPQYSNAERTCLWELVWMRWRYVFFFSMTDFFFCTCRFPSRIIIIPLWSNMPIVYSKVKQLMTTLIFTTIP